MGEIEMFLPRMWGVQGIWRACLQGAYARLAGDGDVNQTKNEFLPCMGPWARSLTSERKKKVRNKKELDFGTTSLLVSSIFLLSVSVLLSLYKNLIIKDYRDSSTLKSTYCPCRDPSLVPSIQKGPLPTFCKSRRRNPPHDVCIRMLVPTYTYTHNQKSYK